MDWLATLRRSGGINAIARHLGTPPGDTTASVEALLPGVIAQLYDYRQRHGGGSAGTAALLALFARFGEGELAALVMGPDPLPATVASDLLAALGPGESARADGAAPGAVAGAELLERVRPPLVMLVGGYFAALASGGCDHACLENLGRLVEPAPVPADPDDADDADDADGHELPVSGSGA